MTSLRLRCNQILLTSLLMGMLVPLGACSKKAQMIQVGAAQFEVESIAAIEKIDELRRKEIEAKPLPPEKASEFFVKSVKGSTKPITLETLRILINPLKLDRPQSESQWQAFLQKLRHQYITFTATFASLDKGSLFVASAVKQTIPILDKLISQMAALAQSIKDKPVEFIRERAAIAAQMEQVRDSKPYTEITDLKLLELERRLREVVAAEEQITRHTIEQTLKAATVGTELRKLLLNYDHLSFDDIAEGLSVAFKLVAGFPGLDISSLKAATDDLVTQIKDDETLNNFFDTALSEIISARTVPGG